MHRNERWRARRRDVTSLQIRNQKGILIVVPDQPDIRDPEDLCNQLWLEGALCSEHGKNRFPSATKDSASNPAGALPMRIGWTGSALHMQPGFRL